MDIVMDKLSLVLLAGISLLAVVHLVLLRKPDPATHPLILGRQSDLDKVRHPNESPIFVSSTTGLGGLAKQLVKGFKSIHDTYSESTTTDARKPARIVLGAAGKNARLVDKVDALVSALRYPVADKAITIKLEDPTDALTMLLASSQLSESTHSQPPTMLLNAGGLASYASSPLAVSSSDLQLLKAIPSEKFANTEEGGKGTVLLVNSGPQPPNMDPEKYLPSNWQVAKRINVESLSVANLEKSSPESTEKQDSGAVFARMQVSSAVTEGIVELPHRNILQGGLISLLSIFPPNERPTPDDSILSFESTSTPYGLTVALMCAAVGSTFRLCTPQRGIVARCKASQPSIIFCTPNELNAIRAAMNQILPKNESLLYPIGKAYKTSLLDAGSVSKTTFWDKIIFGKVREGIVGGRLRCIVCSAEEGAGPAAEVVDFMRIALGIPVIVAMTHPVVAGPVTNTLFHDYQRFPEKDGKTGLSHVGGPSTTVECKLVGIDEDEVKANIYRGQLAVRGPSVLRNFIRLQGMPDVSLANGWTNTGIRVELQTNGTMKPIKK